MSKQQPESTPSAIDRKSGRQPGELPVIWIVCVTYGAFYFCRQNLSVALPLINDELGYSKTDLAFVFVGFKLAYAFGQLVNGQLAESLSPRRMLLVGMLGSALLNVVFGFGAAFSFFVFAWTCNGFFQSLGWTPCVRVIGNWIPVRRRGKAIGIVGTGYQVGLGLTFLVASFAMSEITLPLGSSTIRVGLNLGWRGAFWINAGLLAAVAVVMWLFLRESPGPSGEKKSPRHDAAEKHDAAVKKDRLTLDQFANNLVLTLSNPSLWLLAVSLGMLNACRYGFLDWGVTHLTEIELEKTGGTLEAGVVKSAVKYAVLPLGAVVGSFVGGWMTDRFFGSRRAPVICGMLVLLGCLTLVYDQMARSSFVGTMVLLAFVGFAVFGAQVLLVGTAPADLARQGTSAAAAGFVNFMGYVGAALLGDLLTAYLVKIFDWQVAIYFWAGWAFLAAIAVTFLWNAKSQVQTETT